MVPKFAFIGSGSQVFTRNLVRDILTFPSFTDSTIALMDIDPERLELSRQVVQRIVNEAKAPARVIATLDRAEALDGANGVLATILVGSYDTRYHDIRIPLEYGVDQNIGDTRGPGGIFKFLRTLPAMIEICRDIERLCPKAIFLNYTNPMAMLCRAMQEVSPCTVTGLCHSVQGTAKVLAEWIDAPMSEITYQCAGINHQAFFLEYRRNGIDVIEQLREAVLANPKIYNQEQVRNEMFLALGYFVTESSGHNSEYNWWFRKRPDLIEKYCTHGTGWNPGKSAASWLREYAERADRVSSGVEEPYWIRNAREFMAQETIDLNRGPEYASYIFNAVFGDRIPFEFNGNVRNFGLIDNLPWGCCVEVPTYASVKGIQPTSVGKLPPQLAALISLNAQIEEMVVEGALSGDRELIRQALCYDPLSAAVCSLAEIKTMFDEMWDSNKQYLEWFGNFGF